MTVHTEFNYGDDVYFVVSKPETNPKCPICDGQGFIMYRNYKFLCTICDKGVIKRTIPTFNIERGHITEIRITANSVDETKIDYCVQSYNNPHYVRNFNQKEIYDTQKEAEIAKKRLIDKELSNQNPV